VTAPASPGTARLVAALRAQGGTLAELTGAADASAAAAGPGPLVAAGPRARGREGEYELLVEMIFEGSRLHYGPQRVVRTDDADLALLVGDQLYALGLAQLAQIGDLEAIGELADVISLVAQAQIACDAELADAVWDAGAVAIGWGAGAGHAEAKELARVGDPGAAAALRRAAASRDGGAVGAEGGAGCRAAGRDGGDPAGPHS
jgi:hypothetical protein